MDYKKEMKPKQGFATMDKEKQREISRKGGLAVSANREHMSRIGLVGGRNSGKKRAV